MSVKGIEADMKDLGSLVNISFPQALRSMQSFLGSLNYYSRFIWDFSIYASVFYESRKAVFHEIRLLQNTENGGSSIYDDVRNTQIDDDRGQRPAGDHDHQLVTMNGQDQIKVEESIYKYWYSSLGEDLDCVYHVEG